MPNTTGTMSSSSSSHHSDDTFAVVESEAGQQHATPTISGSSGFWLLLPV